jgi:hypothetical protein
LTDEYSSEKAPDDGTFYRKIREYQGYLGEANAFFEKRWLARLSAESEHKRECFDQLSRHPGFRAAFDSLLLDIPALDGGMRLGTMHKVIGMRCDEVSILHLRACSANKCRNTFTILGSFMTGGTSECFEGTNQRCESLLEPM